MEGKVGSSWKNLGTLDFNTSSGGPSSYDEVINSLGYSQVRLVAIHTGTINISNISAKQYDPILYISNGKIIQKVAPDTVVPIGSTSGTLSLGSTGVKWIDVTGKPFVTIGTGLSVSSDELNVNIGTDVQAWDAQLDTLAGMSSAQATGLVGTSGTATFNKIDVINNGEAQN